jgi:hypothetical protein
VPCSKPEPVRDVEEQLHAIRLARVAFERRVPGSVYIDEADENVFVGRKYPSTNLDFRSAFAVHLPFVVGKIWTSCS